MSNLAFFEHIRLCSSGQENITLTVINGEGYGEHAIFSDGALVYSSQKGGFLESHCSELAGIRETGIITVADSSIYAERVGAGKKIIICGAGHVSIPVISLAKLTGFHVTVIDDRSPFAENARKAGADLVICGSFAEALGKIHSDANSYFVVITRGHFYDSECLRVILRKPYAYLGMMGSARRGKIVRESLINDGYDYGAVAGIHSPIGLSISAETPEEIAVSIMAEIIQVKNRSKDCEFPEEILAAIALPERKVLCTVVSKQGAGPRSPGTKMLCTSDGKTIGTIGGGVIEAEVMKKAAEMFRQDDPKPELMRFSLTAGALSKDGEVCGGVVHIWIESI